jgi:CBS domain-containing protein
MATIVAPTFARRATPANIANQLTPKSDVVWVRFNGTLADAVERMRTAQLTAVPALDDHGRYAGTLTEGDVLWYLLGARGFDVKPLERTPVHAVPRRVHNRAVHIDASVRELVRRALHQNFVPVADDRDAFIGIVRRQHIIEHCAELAGLDLGIERS